MSASNGPIAVLHLSVILAVVALSTVAQPAAGQIGDATGLAEALQPEYLERDVVLFAEGLNLDETQRVIVEALFEDYLDGFAEAEATMRQRFEQMQDELQSVDKAAVVKMALQPLRDLIGTKDALREDLHMGVQTVLTDQQLDQWPSFVRRMRREKTMHKGRLDGESIDLFHVIRDMDIPETVMRQVQPVLDEYEIVLDQALVARNESFKRAQLDLLTSISDNQRDIGTGEAERQVDLRIRIRDVNDQYRVAIAESLPDPLGGQFRQLALERAYPQIYRKTLMQRIFADAVELEGLDTDTMQTIRQLQADYEAELAEVNATLLASRQHQQPQEMLERIESFKARMSGQRPNRAASRARQDMYQRDAIAEPYMESLRAALTSEQFASLPEGQRFLQRQERLRRMRGLDELRGKDNVPALQGSGDKKPPDRR